MLELPSVSPEVKNYISGKLAAVEAQYAVRILLAVESGSRAWGFPSADSDYDVRFIYAHSRDDYLSVQSLRDVIETPLMHDEMLGVPMDMNGWDIRKALQLAIKSNTVLTEWFTSPIRYKSTEVVEDVKSVAGHAARLDAFEHHYNRLARNAWEQILESGQGVKLKLYCYALRPALALHWIRESKSLPPMDVISLGSKLEPTMQQELAALIDRKAKARESDMIPRNRLLDTFVEKILVPSIARPTESAQNEMLLEQADKVFRKVVSI